MPSSCHSTNLFKNATSNAATLKLSLREGRVFPLPVAHIRSRWEGNTIIVWHDEMEPLGRRAKKKKKENAWTNFVTQQQQQQQLRAPGIRTLFFPRRPSSWIKMNEKGFSTLFFFFFLGYCHTGGFRGCISPPWSTRMTESFLSRRVEVPRGGVGLRFVCSGTQSWKFSNLCYFVSFMIITALLSRNNGGALSLFPAKRLR